MGWSKYTEDNNEIISERMRDRETRSIEPQVRLYASVPVKTIPVDFTVHIQAVTKETVQKKTPTSRTLRCRDCGKHFVFTIGEQRFFNDHGYQPPKRCRTCREIKRKMDERRFWDGLVRSN